MKAGQQFGFLFSSGLFRPKVHLLLFSLLLIIDTSTAGGEAQEGKEVRTFFQSITSAENPEILESSLSFVMTGSILGSFSFEPFDMNSFFEQEVEEAWELAYQAEAESKNNTRRTLQESDLLKSIFTDSSSYLSPYFPFLACCNEFAQNETKSGFQRLKALGNQLVDSLIEFSDVEEFQDFGVNSKRSAGTNSPIYPMFNNEDGSCFAFRVPASAAKSVKERATIDGQDMKIIPFTYSMKVEAGTIDETQRRLRVDYNIFNDIPKIENTSSIIDLEYMVKLSPGTGDGNVTRTESYASQILKNARKLTELGAMEVFGSARNRQLRRHLRGKQKAEENKDNVHTESKAPSKALSFFSLLNSSRKSLNEGRNSHRSRILGDNGEVEICKSILESVTYRENFPGDSFTLKLSTTASQIDGTYTVTRCIYLYIISIAYQPETFSIAAIPLMKTFNHMAKSIIQGGTDGTYSPFHKAGITGAGQVVAVSDTGLDLNHCSFYDATGEVPKNGKIEKQRRKVIQYVPSGSHSGYTIDEDNGHGTHVSGTIAGHMSKDGINEEDGYYDGVAPGSKIAFMDISKEKNDLSPPSDPKMIFEPGMEAGARVHTCSWGAQTNFGQYSYFSQAFDTYLLENPSMVVVVAAGNFGSHGVAWPGTAKNVITVGASYNALDAKRTKLAWFSGQGFVDGYRTKPDIIAPGSYITSAQAGESCSAVPQQGTSMAAPVVSGAIALIRQYFSDRHYKELSWISACLIKAILLNGAQPLDGTAYDSKENFGLMNLMSSLPLKGENKINAKMINWKSIHDGEVHSYQVTIDTSDGCNDPLSAALVWADLATSGFLLNDLDLLIKNKGVPYYPNGLNMKDDKNNAERVRIESVQSGEVYTISVTAENIVQNKVQYALVITGCFL